jgi:hypothetical protein
MKTRLIPFALACVLVAVPATAQVNYFFFSGIGAVVTAVPTLPVTLSSPPLTSAIPSPGS